MEEKERYIIDHFGEYIFDTKIEDYPSNQTICEIINQQDKQIKELEKESKELEIKLDKCGTELVNAENLVSYLENENQQLKQQLHDLPKKIVEDIRTDFLYGVDGETTGIDIILDTILKKFGGEE